MQAQFPIVNKSPVPCRQLQWADISTEYVRHLIQLAKAEDSQGAGLRIAPERTGDISSQSFSLDIDGQAMLLARTPLTVCGMQLPPLINEVYGGDVSFHPTVKDGQAVAAGTSLGILTGPALDILKFERVMLNFIQHLSGIATMTARYTIALKNSTIRLLDTRKTTPGYRMLEKFAVACGGGWNHRLGLFDWIMLKDNHIAAKQRTKDPSSLQHAIAKAKHSNPMVFLEVEVDTLEQIDAVLTAEADMILLDNFSSENLQMAIDKINSRAWIEVSGGITLEQLPNLLGLSIDFISSGAITHHSVWQDIGLDWELV